MIPMPTNTEVPVTVEEVSADWANDVDERV
jgi:hypothetical protein